MKLSLQHYVISLFVFAPFIAAAPAVSQIRIEQSLSDSSTASGLALPYSGSINRRMTRATLSAGARIGAASQIDNWDWTQEGIQTLYFDFPGFDSLKVRLPWFDPGSLTYDQLGYYPKNEIDFSPAQGWVLIFKALGTDSLPVNGQPEFVLYNRYRGILRFFFWNPFSGSQTFDYMLASLTIYGETSTSLLSFYPGNPQFSDQYPSIYNDNSSAYSVACIRPNSWCYVDFNLTGFDDQISQKYCTLGIEVWGLKGSLVINGGTPVEQVISGSNEQTRTALNLQVAGNEPVMDSFKEIRGLPGLNQEITNLSDSASGGWKRRALKSLAGEATNSTASWIGGVSLLAGAVDAFVGLETGGNLGNQVSAAMPFVYNGSTSLSGNFTPLLLGFSGFALPGSQSHTIPNMPAGQSSYNEPLGIFNVVTKPTIGYCFKVNSYQDNSGDRSSYLYGTPCFGLDKALEIVYNPSDGLTLLSAKIAFTDSTSGPVTTYEDVASGTVSTFTTSVPVQITKHSPGDPASQVGKLVDGPVDKLPPEIALKLKFTYVDTATSEVDTVLFLKTYSVNYTYDPSVAGRTAYRPLASDTAQTGSTLPQSFVFGNYPNPFNPQTRIIYEVSVTSHVSLDVYNALGQKVATLLNGTEDAGIHDAVFDGSGFASGVYFLRFITQSENGGTMEVKTTKMVLLK